MSHFTKRFVLTTAFSGLMIGATVPANAAVIATIDDLAEGLPLLTATGCGVLTTVLAPESVNMHCEYIALFPGSTTVPRLPPGVGTSLFFNIYDPGGVVLSDTLVISFTGQAPVVGVNLNNMSVDLVFRSDTEGVALTPLVTTVNGFNVIETGAFQNLDPLIEGTVPSSGFSLSFRSNVERVPEPITISLVGLGLAGLGFSRRKKVS